MRNRGTGGSAARLPLRLLLLMALLAAAVPPGGWTQEALAGRVLKQGQPVAGAPVTLHQVSRDTAGAIAETVSDASGRFLLALPRADTAAGFNVFFATAEHLGTRYFGSPVHPGEHPADYAIAVFDTATAQPGTDKVRLVRRDIVLFPQPDGGWEVNEVLLFANSHSRTLVAPTGVPTWEFRIPGGVAAFEAGEGSFDPDRVVRMGERVLLLAPLIPGRHQMTVRYRLAPTTQRAEFDLAQPADSLRVLVQQPSPRITVEGLAPAAAVRAETMEFAQFAAGQLPPGHRIRLSWRGSAPPIDPRGAAVTTAALLLLGAVVVAVRNGLGRSGA